MPRRIRRSGIARDDVFIETKIWISDYGCDSTLQRRCLHGPQKEHLGGPDAARDRVSVRFTFQRKEIGVAEPTTASHVAQILKKLGVRNRTEAVAAALERGILTTK
jgi:hypothetical protein